MAILNNNTYLIAPNPAPNKRLSHPSRNPSTMRVKTEARKRKTTGTNTPIKINANMRANVTEVPNSSPSLSPTATNKARANSSFHAAYGNSQSNYSCYKPI